MPDPRRATRGWPLFAAVALATGCVPPAAAPAVSARISTDAVRELPARPPLAVVVRDGDPRAAVAVTVLTLGVDDAAKARLPTALAGIVEARLAAKGVADASVAPTWDGYRVRALVPLNGDATALLRALRDALLTPIGPDDVAPAQKKLVALANRPLHDAALADVARCTGEPAGESRDAAPPTVATLEHWRASSHGLGRIVFGAVGTGHAVDALATSLLAEPPWPNAEAPRPHGDPAGSPPLAVYDATRDVAPGAARVTLAVRVPSAANAADATALLADRNGPLTTRLHAIDALIALREVTATAEGHGGCIAVVLDVPRTERRHDADGENPVAAALGVARQEVRLALSRATTAPPVRRAALLGDPREAAENAAWWALVDDGHPAETAPPRESTVVGLGSAVDAVDFAARAKALEQAVERDDGARKVRILDAKTATEQGQGAVWFLLGSPCGTFDEGDADAGLTAVAVSALAEHAREANGGVEISEWITSQGVGLLGHGTPRAGESPRSFVARSADALGSAFMTGAVSDGAISRARAALMSALSESEARSFVTLADVLTPGHPSWTFPLGTGRSLDAWPDGAIRARIAALRHGPLRLAVLGNDDATQVAAATDAIDRWAPHAAGTSRTCPSHATLVAPKAGTYVAPSAPTSTAWLAVPVAATDHDAAVTLAAALDGPDGLLAHALSAGIASTWSARVVGPADATALAIRVGAPGHDLDAAVAQVRALLDRLRQGALTDDDRTRAEASLARTELASSLDPRQRLVRLWRGDTSSSASPSLDALRRFALQALHDESLIIVAARPPKVTP